MNRKEKRYQECPWYVRLWRRRWYLMIPIWATQSYFVPWRNPKNGKLAHNHPYKPFWQAWSIAVGTAHSKMRWYYTWDEVFNKHTKI